MSELKTDYLILDGLTIDQKLKNNLNSYSTFTDQNYSGSNLNILNKSMSYAFSLLMYYLNQTVHGTSYSETEIYENMNKILKQQGYKPLGYQTSSVSVSLSAPATISVGVYNIPRFSYSMVGGLKFSLSDDLPFSKTTTTEETLNITGSILHQGEFIEKEFPAVQGIEMEKLVLSIPSDVMVDHYNFRVYVKNNNKWSEWNSTASLYLNSSDDKVFEYRLNENKNYEFVFGNDINGRKLQKGDTVVVYYLKTSGSKGEIAKGKLNKSGLVRFKSKNYNDILNDTATITNYPSYAVSVTNNQPSIPFGEMETVDEMRNNSPQLYRSQFRLVTESDYLAYIKSNFSNIVQDVKVMSNKDYLDSYMKYFWDMGVSKADWESRALFNQTNFADSTNFNNVYAFIVPKGSDTKLNYLQPSQKNIIINSIQNEKILTSEFLVADPVYLFLNIAHDTSSQINLSSIDVSRINVKMSKFSRRNSTDLKNEIDQIFKDYFYKRYCSLGQTVDVVQLNSDILSLEGVESISTENVLLGSSVQGLSFIVWNPAFPDISTNLHTSNILLEEFQFPFFLNLDFLINRINII